MQASDKSISSLLSEKTTFCIPIYQRNYEWTIKNCEKMLNEIITTEEYFLGIIVTFRDKKKNIKYLIDGQQRLTTFYLILLALKKILEELTGEEQELFRTLIFSENKILDKKPLHKRIKIKHNDVDKAALENLVSEESVVIGKTNIEKNYLFIYKYLEELIENTEDIELLFENLDDKLNRVEIVELVLEEGDNPQQVFESLNSSGLKLNSAELIKNYILLNESADNQMLIISDYWDPFEEKIGINNLPEFFRVFLSFKNKFAVKNQNIYENFKEYFSNEISTKEKLEEIAFYIELYFKLKNKKHSIPEIENFLKLLDRLGAIVFYGLFFHLETEYLSNRLSKEDFIRIIKISEVFFLRRYVCGYTNQASESMFLDIIKVTEENHLFNFIAYLKDKTNSLNKFPNDNEVKDSFFYNELVSKRDYVARYIFYKIEIQDKKEQISFESIYLKPIVPINLTREWRRILDKDVLEIKQFQHSLCNFYISLSPKEKLEEEKSFNYKKDKFIKERFLTTDYLTEFDTWSYENAWNYNEFLLEQFLFVWKNIDLLAEEYGFHEDINSNE